MRHASYRRQTFHRHSHPTYSLGIVVRGVTEFVYRGQRQRALKRVIWCSSRRTRCTIATPLATSRWPTGCSTSKPPCWAHRIKPVSTGPCTEILLFALWLHQALGLREWCDTQNAALAQTWRQDLRALWPPDLAAWPSATVRVQLARGGWPAGASTLVAPGATAVAGGFEPAAGASGLSARVGISPSHLNRRFGAEVGLPPIAISCSCASRPPKPVGGRGTYRAGCRRSGL